MLVYHGTSLKKAEKILETGAILPHHKLTEHNFNDGFYEESDRAYSVYVGERHIAEDFANTAVNEESAERYVASVERWQKRVIFVLDIPDDKLIPDEYFTTTKSAWRIVTDGISIGDIKDMIIM